VSNVVIMEYKNLEDDKELLVLNEPEVVYGHGQILSQVISATRLGFTFDDILKFQKTINKGLAGFAYILQISLRTLQRYTPEKKLNTPQSERLLEVSRMYGHGYEVFGSRKKFNQWMDVPNPALGGVTPFSLLDTRAGLEMVDDLIGRIEHGVLS